MAITVRVKMLRPVGGYEEGAFRTLGVADAERLEARGAVEIVGKPTRSPAQRQKPKARGAKAAPKAKNKAAPKAKNKAR